MNEAPNIAYQFLKYFLLKRTTALIENFIGPGIPNTTPKFLKMALIKI